MNATDFRRVETAIRYLDEHALDQPKLADVAAHVALSPAHFQRVFQRCVGVSPKRFLQCLTVEDAKTWLARSRSVLETTYRVGLSGPARLYDHFVALEAMTPGEYRARGADLVIRHGTHETPLGRCLVATTERGVCRVAFPAEGELPSLLEDLRAHWSRAHVVHDASATAAVAARMFASPGGDVAPDVAAGAATDGLRVLVRGTNFQVQVWRALLRIPSGRLSSYGALAQELGRPRAARAVGTAVGRNPVAVLIPCHRVVRGSGALGGYRWGLARKRALLALESARAPAG